MRRQVIQSLHALLTENQSLHQISDGVQQTIKKFFKFQIEEEQMREQVDASFRALTGIASLHA
jgi:Flp pilus assembly protein TadB